MYFRIINNSRSVPFFKNVVASYFVRRYEPLCFYISQCRYYIFENKQTNMKIKININKTQITDNIE